MEPKKNMQTDEPLDTVSWLSHATRIFGQPEKLKENNKCVIPNVGIIQNGISHQKSSQTSTEQHNIEDVVADRGFHVFKDEKSKNDNCSKLEKTPKNVAPESIGSKNRSNSDQNNGVKENEAKNDEMMKCLDFIQNVAVKLKNKDDDFCNTIMKILDVDKMQDSRVKTLKYNVLNIVFLLLDSPEDYLKLIEETLQAMVVPNSMKRFVVPNNSCVKPFCYVGEGSTSIVRTAILSKDGVCTPVALKTPHSTVFHKMIINEATVLSQLDQKNIIKMLAFVKNGPEIALEFLELGNLYQAVESVRFSDRELLTALIDIATGMEFLHEKQYLHRDLACRNVFVTVRKKCKIGDFGLSVYVGDSNGVFQDKETELQVRNYCPETIFSRIFTFKTDVWSMGLVILELYYLVTSGFGGFLQFLTVLIPLIREGDQLKKPERCRRCPDDLFQFTTNCLLNRNFEKRPNFSVIRETVENCLKKN